MNELIVACGRAKEEKGVGWDSLAESMTETKGPRKQEMKLIRTEKIFYGKKTKKAPERKKARLDVERARART